MTEEQNNYHEFSYGHVSNLLDIGRTIWNTKCKFIFEKMLRSMLNKHRTMKTVQGLLRCETQVEESLEQYGIIVYTEEVQKK